MRRAELGLKAKTRVLIAFKNGPDCTPGITKDIVGDLRFLCFRIIGQVKRINIIRVSLHMYMRLITSLKALGVLLQQSLGP